ncbi:hypothetical protein Patl1_27562 [Pistacia atlantica]|uniref:Uncharacterized protein n=1 Tax=Pistacia atlantica TaxID=434234 RepID=A0ACC1BC65_9ROSI|nr:hypothetical protein Patl1_27562 [Pistacia atlantica]
MSKHSRLNNNSLSAPIPVSLMAIMSLEVLTEPLFFFDIISVENSPTAAIAGGVAAGSALVLFAALPVGFAYWWLRKPQGCFFDAAVEEDPEVQFRTAEKIFFARITICNK